MLAEMSLIVPFGPCARLPVNRISWWPTVSEVDHSFARLSPLPLFYTRDFELGRRLIPVVLVEPSVVIFLL
jgi:hypothetical protein